MRPAQGLNGWISVFDSDPPRIAGGTMRTARGDRQQMPIGSRAGQGTPRAGRRPRGRGRTAAASAGMPLRIRVISYCSLAVSWSNFAPDVTNSIARGCAMKRGIRMNRMIRWTALAGLAAAAALGGGLSLAGGVASGEGGSAVAVLHPTENSPVSGVVRFARTAGGITITATVKGLAPGKHGFHIHELGDCSAPDATSAGGHYNPDGYPHAGPDKRQRHMGDMGNIEADKTGRAQYERLDAYLTLNGPKSVIGRAVIVHAGEDDLSSQPTGNAGGRQACGVIGISR